MPGRIKRILALKGCGFIPLLLSEQNLQGTGVGVGGSWGGGGVGGEGELGGGGAGVGVGGAGVRSIGVSGTLGRVWVTELLSRGSGPLWDNLCSSLSHI